jgi:hypothetical protein
MSCLALAFVGACSTTKSLLGEKPAGTSGNVPMRTNPNIPAAQGSLKYSVTNNNDTRIDLSVEHLADPSRISAEARTFVVWVKPTMKNGHPQNVGEIRVNQNLAGSLETVTPYHDFDVFVTAEPTGTVDRPSGDRILSANVAVNQQAPAGPG